MNAPATTTAHRWRHSIGWILLGAATLLLWHIPALGWLVYPFRLFGTFVHEIGHGLAAIATGGDFQRFAVQPDLSGLAWSAGGIRIVVASAGYIGSAVFGAALILLATRFSARALLFLLGLMLGVLCLLFVRNPFGIVSGLSMATGLLVAAWRLGPLGRDGLLSVLALQSIFDGFNSLFDVFWLSTGSQVHTDAHTLAALTHVPAPVWVVVWMAVSLAVLLASLRWAWRDRLMEPLNKFRGCTRQGRRAL